MNKEHFEYIKPLIEDFVYKYAIRKNNFVALTSIIGDFSNDILLRAIRNVMFDVHNISELSYDRGKARTKTKRMWILKYQPEYNYDKGNTDKYVSFITKKVIDEELRLHRLLISIHSQRNRRR